MNGMQSDMSGAAVLLGLVLTAARLGLPVRLTAFLCMAENLVSSTAIRVNDILTIRGGTTVELMNTDAEGRLVMADETGDAHWPMPLPDELRSHLTSRFADMTNTKVGNRDGAAYGYLTEGATGVSLRTLLATMEERFTV